METSSYKLSIYIYLLFPFPWIILHNKIYSYNADEISQKQKAICKLIKLIICKKEVKGVAKKAQK